MADYFTSCSFDFACSQIEADRLNAAFGMEGKSVSHPDTTSLPEILVQFWGNTQNMVKDITGEPADDNLYFGIEESRYKEGRYWIHADTNPEISNIAKVIATVCQEALQKEPIAFQWSNSASKPLLDAFGGGVCIITKDMIHIGTTQQWVDDALKALATGRGTIETPKRI